MKIMTIKLHKGRVIAALLLVAGIGIAVAATLSLPKKAASVQGNPGSSTEERISFLDSFGWAVKEEPLMVTEALLPADETDKAVVEYQRLQKSAGLDLGAALGKRVKCYVYEVTNHPDGRSDALAVLLVESGRVVAGHIQLGQGEDALRQALNNRKGELTEKSGEISTPGESGNSASNSKEQGTGSTAAAQGGMGDFPTD